VITVFHYQS